MMGKAFAIWLAILIMAIANGAHREFILIPLLGEVPGFVLSGTLLSILILVITFFTLPWLGTSTPAQHVALGCAWLLLTLTFEFIFGHYVQGKSWTQLLDAYTFQNGNLWPIVLLVTAMAPTLAAKARGFVH